jgi:hypothetical protein
VGGPKGTRKAGMTDVPPWRASGQERPHSLEGNVEAPPETGTSEDGGDGSQPDEKRSDGAGAVVKESRVLPQVSEAAGGRTGRRVLAPADSGRQTSPPLEIEVAAWSRLWDRLLFGESS